MATEIKKDSKNWGRKFQVTTGSVGAWNKGDVFQESTFQFLNAIPTPVDATTRLPLKDLPEGHPIADQPAYFNALLDRLLGLCAIVMVPDATICSPIPIGPGGQHGASVGSIAESMNSVIRSRKIAAESIAMRPPEGPAPEDRTVVKTAIVSA